MWRTIGAVLVAARIVAAAGGPQVTKIEPPDWWTGSTVTPLRLLVRGVNLAGAKLTAQAPLKAAQVQVNERGTYLFADLTIPRSTRPGEYAITITTPGGSTDSKFRVVASLPPGGRFQGITPDDILYLIMPDRFANGDPANDDPPQSRGLLDRAKGRFYHGGDLQGIINKLPYLKSLGVTALWLNPWYDNVNHPNAKERYDNENITDYHGYGAVDFYGVEEHFGNLAKLQELVEKAHASGLKVIQDQVANHTGPYHPWATDPPHSRWYHGTPQDHPDNDWQTWTLMDPYASAEIRRRTLDGWFINILPDLNQDDPEVKRYLIQNSLWWVGRTGLDAIRQDTVPYAPRAFWREWTGTLAREWPKLNVIGEVFDGDPAMVSFFQGGARRFDGVDSGLQSLFDFPLFYPIRRAFAGDGQLRDIAKAIAHDHLYPNPNLLVTFLGLHDVSRFMSEPGATPDGLRLALATLFTMRGVPMIYYGDEIGMEGGNDPDNRRDFPSAFSPEQQTRIQWVQKLAALRRQTPALRQAKTLQLFASEHLWAFRRDNAVVVINNGAAGASLKLDTGLASNSSLTDRLGTLGTVPLTQGHAKIDIPAKSVSVLLP